MENEPRSRNKKKREDCWQFRQIHSHSLAILKYTARRHDLIPTQLATADMLKQ